MAEPSLFNTSPPLRRARRCAHRRRLWRIGAVAWIWDPTMTRLAYIVATVASIGFPGILTYLLLWLIMPRD